MNATAQKIILAAERMIRDGGYHSFSFRQIAEELHMKSASIHYHFPTKEALGTAVTKLYTVQFMTALGDPSQQKKPISHYIEAFKKSLQTHQRPCLCGILAAESGRLPQSIKEALQDFTQQNIQWLELAIKLRHEDWPAKKRNETAAIVFSALEGAITFSALTEQSQHLDKVSRSLQRFID